MSKVQVATLVIVSSCSYKLISFLISIATSISLLVCPDEQLLLTCTTNSTTIQWEVSNAVTPFVIGRQFITTTGMERLEPIAVNSSVFQFSRTSILPLTSLLQIDNITAQLNETLVNCSSTSGISTTLVLVLEKSNTHNIMHVALLFDDNRYHKMSYIYCKGLW